MIKLRSKTTELIAPRYGDLPIQIIRLIGWIKLHRKDGSFLQSAIYSYCTALTMLILAARQAG